MKLECVNKEYQHYFIVDDEPHPKLNNKEIKKYTNFIYSLAGYTKKKIKILNFNYFSAKLK